MTKRSHMIGAIAGLLLLSLVVSGCGTTTPAAADWPGLTVAGVTYQVTIDGKPLYHYANDVKAGDTAGQGIGGVWYVVQMTTSAEAPAQGAGGAPTVTVASNASLGNILADENGMTLYTYAKDTANVSNCSGECATTWLPLTVPEDTTPTAGPGVTGTVGVIERADRIVYSISGSPEAVYLLNAETGVQEAAFSAPSEAKGTFYWSPVTLGGGLAFVGLGVPESKLFALYAFDPATAVRQWDVPADSPIMAAPVYDEETNAVYFATAGGSVYAADVQPKSLKPGWPVLVGGGREAIWGSPLVAGTSVYVPSLDHHIYCLDAQTGQQKWSFATRGAVAAQPRLSPDGRVLYFGDFAGRVYAVSVDTGQEVGGFGFQAGNWIWSEVLLADDRLYVTAMDGKLYTLDPATGETLNEFDPPEGTGNSSSPLRAAPVKVGDNLILVASEAGYVTALNTTTNAKEWQWPQGTPTAGILTTPVVVKAPAGTSEADRVYVVLVSGKVYALSADRGAQSTGNWPAPP